ncbi:unnamed protein product [Durusdinium trenchii]|uniref:Uncharacterized protein n=2 Tax=Durusdinium trenchii TaxID=1381693 RepID=A0ABP0S441_9DINO
MDFLPLLFAFGFGGSHLLATASRLVSAQAWAPPPGLGDLLPSAPRIFKLISRRLGLHSHLNPLLHDAAKIRISLSSLQVEVDQKNSTQISNEKIRGSQRHQALIASCRSSLYSARCATMVRRRVASATSSEDVSQGLQ